MRLTQWAARAVSVTVLIVGAAAAAHAQVVTFSDLNDAVPGSFFDAATSAPDPTNANRLIIGLHSGIDWNTWKYTDFRASTASFSHMSVVDTISFRITAPDGFYVSKVIYAQRGSGSVLRTGRAAGGGSWVVSDFASDLGTFTTGSTPTFTREIDLEGLNLTFVPVSITQSLFAFSTPTLGSASVTITGASVEVVVLPLPVPEPPIEEPAVEEESVEEPPVEDAPAEGAPEEKASVEEPPAAQAPATQPPSEQSPAPQPSDQQPLVKSPGQL